MYLGRQGNARSHVRVSFAFSICHRGGSSPPFVTKPPSRLSSLVCWVLSPGTSRPHFLSSFISRTKGDLYVQFPEQVSSHAQLGVARLAGPRGSNDGTTEGHFFLADFLTNWARGEILIYDRYVRLREGILHIIRSSKAFQGHQKIARETVSSPCDLRPATDAAFFFGFLLLRFSCFNIERGPVAFKIEFLIFNLSFGASCAQKTKKCAATGLSCLVLFL